MTKRVVGLDFGTSTTLIAERLDDAVTRVVPIGTTTSWLPSLVGVDDAGRMLVAEDALGLPPDRIVRSIKSRLTDGSGWAQVAATEELLDVATVVGDILEEALDRAQSRVPGLLENAKVFMGCPALWTGVERKVLVDTAQQLTLDVDIADVIDEPVAAGLAWVNERWMKGGDRPTGRTLVFDGGGGTLDVALLQIVGDETPEITVLSAEGESRSGDVLDLAIAENLSSNINGLEPQSLANALLLERARDLKERLSFAQSQQVALGAPFSVRLSYSRQQLETTFSPQVGEALSLVRSAVKGSRLRDLQSGSPSEIRSAPWEEFAGQVGYVVLVGGMSQIPAIRRQIQTIFPLAAVELVERPQEAVVSGLALGDQLFRLNLPRPPFDFCVRYTTERGAELPDHLSQWAQDHRVIYRAYSPLYSKHDLLMGNSTLGYAVDVPFPPGYHGSLRATLHCEAPDRERTPFDFRIGSETMSGLKTRHDRHDPARFKLYASGEIIFNGTLGQSIHGRIAQWPTLRGPNHDWSREISIEVLGGAPASQLMYDNWRTMK